MALKNHPVVLALAHHLTRCVLALPDSLLAWVGRNVARPEGVAPHPQVAAMGALAEISGAMRAPRQTSDPDRLRRTTAALREATDWGSAVALTRRADGVTTSSHTIAGAEGPIGARLYVPSVATDGRLMVYAHGGGWVVGSLDSHEAPCRFLAQHAATRVLSIDYRLAPEYPFPAGLRDMQAALADIHSHAADWGADPEHITVAGDSAGGNLAAALARRFDGGPRPAAALLIYPVCDAPGLHPSYDLFAHGPLLSRAMMEWFFAQYVPDGHDLSDPEVSPLQGVVTADHPPTFVVTAGFDPLRDEGEAYAAKLDAAGVPTAMYRSRGQAHAFANGPAISSANHDEMAKVAGGFVALQQLHRGVTASAAS